MKTLTLFVSVFIVTSLAMAQEKFLNTEKFDASRDPVKDLAEGVQFAQKHQKRILMEVGGE